MTVSCHDDLTASDLVGRYLIVDNETVWVDGPLARAVRAGGFCYLDEIVEARKDTTVVIHPLADAAASCRWRSAANSCARRTSSCSILSYNPGYQSVLKELKHSTRQRFVAIEFDYPRADLEARIVVTETGIDAAHGGTPGEIRRHDAQPERQRAGRRREHAPAGARRAADAPRRRPRAACAAAISLALSDDPEMLAAIDELASAVF